MKKGFVVGLAAVIISSGLYGVASASQNIAVVDVQAVVAKSAQVQNLKKEQQAKMKEIENWLKTAQADVEKQKTQEGKEKLLKKYNSDFAKKKETLAKDYQTKLQSIDKSITETITINILNAFLPRYFSINPVICAPLFLIDNMPAK